MRVRKHFSETTAGLQYLSKSPQILYRRSIAKGVLRGETGTASESDGITDLAWQRKFDLAKEQNSLVRDYLQQVKRLEHQAQNIAQEEGPVADVSGIEASLGSLWTQIEAAVSEKSTGEAVHTEQPSTQRYPQSTAQASKARDKIYQALSSDLAGLEDESGELQLQTTYTKLLGLVQRLLSIPKEYSIRHNAYTRIVETGQQSIVREVLFSLQYFIRLEQRALDTEKSGSSLAKRSLKFLDRELKAWNKELCHRAGSLGRPVRSRPELREGITCLLSEDRTIIHRLVDIHQLARQEALASASEHKSPQAKQTSAPVTRQTVVADRSRAAAARRPGYSAVNPDKSLNRRSPRKQAEEEVNDFANLPGDLLVVDDSSSAARVPPKSVPLTYVKSDPRLSLSLTIASVDKFRREVKERAHQQTLGILPGDRNQSLAAEPSSSRDSGDSRDEAGEVKSSTTASSSRNTSSIKSVRDIPAEDLIRRLMSGASRLHTPAE
ncbi:hypothetical protein BDZ85DRAFT_281747 [Elsinoe ampelina]|uniref:Uncharacterized protein n=1 Tax=Elsinoe ampelina TaxID=302913 RepID=A0A6A6GDP6_9PEZI|nr:hypothetical protein BDZ85DRAFT_281747 [Elsinoe ampelina]